ncbi:hypothetical protein NP568_24135, partial [Vibrio parahaemolyticus]|nr:hypothetical protein [Vibrio parahaemolyticus]
LYGLTSIGYVLLHLVYLLARMALSVVFMITLALCEIAISQKVNSPFVILFIAIYALRLMPIAMFGYYGLDQLFSAVLYLRMNEI